MEHWGYWLNESIFTDNGVYNIMKRKHAMYAFCKEGLIPFVEKKGYKFRFFDEKVVRVLLLLLYKLYQGHTVTPLATACDNHQEQYALFLERFETDEMDQFWSTWGSIQDFDKDGYAHRLQYELIGFIWSWIDFDTSPAILRLYAELDESEMNEEISKGKDDPYLQETSKRDYQDRHW